MGLRWTVKVPFLQTPVSNKGRTDGHLSMGSRKQLFPERRARDSGLSLGLEPLCVAVRGFHVLSVSLCDMTPSRVPGMFGTRCTFRAAAGRAMGWSYSSQSLGELSLGLRI